MWIMWNGFLGGILHTYHIHIMHATLRWEYIERCGVRLTWLLPMGCFTVKNAMLLEDIGRDVM